MHLFPLDEDICKILLNLRSQKIFSRNIRKTPHIFIYFPKVHNSSQPRLFD